MRKSSHTLDRFGATFDDERSVADAGLFLPASLAERLGLRQLFDDYVDLGGAAGSAGANVGLKAMTLVHSALAGGDCIDDAGALRAGSTSEVLGHAVRAPSTLGTFLRNFTFGHVAQLDKVLGELIARAWAAGAGPRAGSPLTIDLDSSICEVYGLKKQGARFGHTKVRGYHPLLASVAGLDDVLGLVLRGGNAHTGRGAAEFLVKMFNRVRRAGATGPIKMRADSGFYNSLVTTACTRAGVGYSITAKMSKSLNEKIAAIAEEDWEPIPYWLEGGADVAETSWRPFSSNKAPTRRGALRSAGGKGLDEVVAAEAPAPAGRAYQVLEADEALGGGAYLLVRPAEQLAKLAPRHADLVGVTSGPLGDGADVARHLLVQAGLGGRQLGGAGEQHRPGELDAALDVLGARLEIADRVLAASCRALLALVLVEDRERGDHRECLLVVAPVAKRARGQIERGSGRRTTGKGDSSRWASRCRRTICSRRRRARSASRLIACSCAR